MILVTVTEFRNNLSKYLELAFRERVVLKSKQGIIELSPSTEIHLNPSPSNDPWFDVPENMAHLNKAMEAAHAKDAKFFTWDEIKNDLGL